MTDETPSLDALRRQIDAIDNELRDAIVRRMGLIAQVARAKQLNPNDPRSAMRPAREAQILARLTADLPTSVPPFLLARVWGEMINTATAKQSRHAVAVCAPERSVGYWDLARNHFGSATPMTLHRSPVLVLRAVNDNPAMCGVMPLADEGEAEPWWPELGRQAANEGSARIVWRLPFITSPAGRFENPSAYVIARVDLEPCGNDVTIAVVATDLGQSRARLVDLAAASGLVVRLLATHEQRADNQRLHLVEIDGFHVGPGAFDALHAAAGDALTQAVVIGSHPRQIAPPVARD
ncbi:MAG: chorismate mutase [Alphaproteobacteria bacterium]